jgi:YHS domain-containing protein
MDKSNQISVIFYFNRGFAMRLARLSLAFGAILFASSFLTAADSEIETGKKALQAFNEYIGGWKGKGEAKAGKSEFWNESMEWGWKFKDGKVSLLANFKDNKTFKSGELKFVPEKKKFDFVATDANDKSMIFSGEIKKKVLTLERIDEESKDKQIIEISTNNDGARMILTYSVQTKGKGLVKKQYTTQHGKEGVSLASGKKNECVVSGGAGTMAVSFKGKTYYVCCSGCRDAFNETPEVFVAEFEKKQKK